jgi:hypothetical protein
MEVDLMVNQPDQLLYIFNLTILVGLDVAREAYQNCFTL